MMAKEQPSWDLGLQATRQTERIGLTLNATVRERGRNRLAARVIDISIAGCRIEFVGIPFAEESLWISIEGCESVPARLKWQKDGFAGLEFMTLFSDAVLTQMLSQNIKPTTQLASELRDLAKRARLLTQSSGGEEVQAVREFSRDCSLRAIIHALRLGELQNARPAAGQLTSAMVRRVTVSELHARTSGHH